MNAWVWSSIFHVRDFLFTERADYFSAGASVMYGLFYVPLRLFNIHQRNIKQVQAYIYVWAGICGIAFLAHVYYLSFITFSYSYNMAANVMVGIAQNFMWIYYSVTRSRSNRGQWVWMPVFIVIYVSCAMSLEIFDFPPFADALDAHALWHAATIPMVSFPYDAFTNPRRIYSTAFSLRIPIMRYNIDRCTVRNCKHI
jgi:post-GPI attachment to proteins factor 3